MRKIPTLFVRDPDDRRMITSTITPGCEWVVAGEGTATRKYDGTCVMFDGQSWWARREIKPGKATPSGYVLLDTDDVTGKSVGWEPAGQSSFAKFLMEATARRCPSASIGTYELIGPRINGNPERVSEHQLHRHADAEPIHDAPRDFDGLRAFLGSFPGEGIVWHHPDGRMAKIKRRDFGYAKI